MTATLNFATATIPIYVQESVLQIRRDFQQQRDRIGYIVFISSVN